MSKDVQPKPVKTTPWVRQVIIYTVLLLVVFLLGFVPILVRPAQAGEVVAASISSNEQSGESALICLVIVIGPALLAVWVWAEKMWRFIPS